MAQPSIDSAVAAGQRDWAPVLPAGMAADAVAVAQDVACRLRDPQRVRAAVTQARRQSSFPQWMRWIPHDIARGDAGLALVCGHLDACFPGGGWDVTAHRYLSSAACSVEQREYLSPCLFSGLGGVAFVAWSLSRGGVRYRRLLTELDRHLLADTTRRADAVPGAHGVSFGTFDVISGLAGTGASLLGRCDSPEAGDTLRAVLTGLVALCGDHDGIPHWHTPNHAMGPDTPMARQFPHGALNCGLAHGIPGPLALMALASAGGVRVEGQGEALRRAANWLMAHRADDAWGVNWPCAVALPAAPDSPPAVPVPARSAWCYGSPGVARALWLAGVALADEELCTLAVEAMAATYRRPREFRGIDSPTFCHGVAGLLQITLRFAHDTHDPLFVRAATELTGQLLDLYAPHHPLGYYDLEPGGNRVDQPGLLDGAPGVVLSLLAAATRVPPGWDRLFLLS